MHALARNLQSLPFAMRNDQGAHNPPHAVGASGGRLPDDEPPRRAFWRRPARRAPEPPPPIWALPDDLDPPGLWTRLKQRADRWLGQPAGARRHDDTARLAAPAPGKEERPARRESRARHKDTASVRPPGEDRSTRNVADEGEHPDGNAPISAGVLASAYEAVRQGRIADPATIRQLADRFARLTLDEDIGDDLAFDPAAAVRALRQRAAEIAQARGFGNEDEDPSPNPSPARGGEAAGAPSSLAPPSHAGKGVGGVGSRPPRRPTPQIERDENITRGG